MPTISIITICRNAKADLERSLDSLASQTYTDYEHVLIDGASTDGTLDLLESHRYSFEYCVSEPDGGISDAFNKGIAKSKGVYLVFLNAGDVFASYDSLLNAVQALDSSADITLFDPCFSARMGSGFERKHHAFSKKLLYLLQTYPQPATIYRRDLFSTVGAFRKELKYTMDTEFLLRSMQACARIKRVHKILIIMSRGGASDANFIRTTVEGWRMRCRNTGICTATIFASLKLARRCVALIIK